jgi:hypothetical protein
MFLGILEEGLGPISSDWGSRCNVANFLQVVGCGNKVGESLFDQESGPCGAVGGAALLLNALFGFTHIRKSVARWLSEKTRLASLFDL